MSSKSGKTSHIFYILLFILIIVITSYRSKDRTRQGKTLVVGEGVGLGTHLFINIYIDI